MGKQTRLLAGEQQVNLGACVVCGLNVWHTCGNAEEVENYREHGGPVHKWHLPSLPLSAPGPEGETDGR